MYCLRSKSNLTLILCLSIHQAITKQITPGAKKPYSFECNDEPDARCLGKQITTPVFF